MCMKMIKRVYLHREMSFKKIIAIKSTQILFVCAYLLKDDNKFERQKILTMSETLLSN